MANRSTVFSRLSPRCQRPSGSHGEGSPEMGRPHHPRVDSEHQVAQESVTDHSPSADPAIRCLGRILSMSSRGRRRPIG